MNNYRKIHTKTALIADIACLVFEMSSKQRLVIVDISSFCLELLELKIDKLPHKYNSETNNPIIDFLIQYSNSPALQAIRSFEIEFKSKIFKIDINVLNEDIIENDDIIEKKINNQKKKFYVELKAIDSKIDFPMAIKDTENKFRELFEASLDGIIITDNNYTCIDCNSAFLKISKYKSFTQIKSKNIIDIISLINKPIIEKIDNSITEFGNFTDYECELIDTNSSTIPVIISIWKRTDSSGSIIGRLIIVRDNAERFKRLSEIESIANIYTTIFNSINDALVIIDYNSNRIEDANKKALEMYGYTRDDVIKLSIEDVSDGNPPYSGYNAQKHFQDTINNGETTIEWLAKNRSGKCFWINCYLKLIKINGKDRILAVISDLSLQKKTLTELKISEEKSRTIFNNSHDSIIVQSIDGSIIDLNKQAINMFGFPADYHNIKIFEIISKDNDYNKLLKIWDDAKSGNNVNLDMIAQKYNSKEVFDIELSLSKFNFGEESFIISTCRDITFRKKSEIQLKNLANRLNLQHRTDKAILGAYSQEDIMEYGITYLKKYKQCNRVTIIYFNQSELTLEIKAFAADSDTLLKKNVLYPIHHFRLTKDFYDGVPIIINNIKDIEKPTVLESQLLKEGLNSYISIPMIAGNELIGSLNMAHTLADYFNSEDIEMALEIADSITVAIKQFELNSKVILQSDMLKKIREIEHNIINEFSVENIAKTAVSNTKDLMNADRASVSIFDYEKDNVVILASESYGKSKLNNNTLIPISDFAISEELKSGKVYYVKDILLMDNRRQIDIDLLNEGIRSHIGFPLMSDNKIIGTLNFGSNKPNAFNEEQINIGSNIAYPLSIALSQAKLRDKIIIYNNNLESVVKERTNELSSANNEVNRLNQVLSKNIAELESTNKELEAFSYSVSHDLRAPLRAMDGFSEVIIEDYSDKLEEDAKHYLFRIRTASQKMAMLIDDLLKLSRITRVEMNTKQIDISAIAADILNEFRINNPDRNIDILINENLTANADESLIRILMTNLIGNAWKFTSKCERANIEIGKEVIDNIKYFYVKDNGAGFDMAYSNKLFRAFQRLHSQTTYEGTGIGLAIAQRIINKHAGSIFAISEIDKGSCFYFSLPE